MTAPWSEGVLLASCARCRQRRPVYVREPVGLDAYRTHAYCEACRTETLHEWKREGSDG